MNENNVEFKAKTIAGEELVIKKDKFHHRAFNKKGEQVGVPFIALAALLNSLEAVLVSPGEEDKAKADLEKLEADIAADDAAIEEEVIAQDKAVAAQKAAQEKKEAGGRDKSVKNIKPGK